ncbi:MAG: PDZ domain-containing protein [Pontimonas sp.]
MTIFEQGDPSPVVKRRSRTVGWLMLAFTAVSAIGLTFFPAPYVIDHPGPTYDTLGSISVDDTELDLISILGAPTYDTTGELRLTTVTRTGNPESLPGWLDVLTGWVDPSQTVIPVSVAYPPGLSVEANREAAVIDMENSQQEAIAAALSYVGIAYSSLLTVNQALEGGPSEGVLLPGDVIISADGQFVDDVTALREIIAQSGTQAPMAMVVKRDGSDVDLEVLPRMSEGETRIPMIGISVSGMYDFPISVDIALDNVGGPSAGAMFALGIVDKLSAEDLTHGQIVAGTGTISAAGEVGPIGGIRHKLLGASYDGATIFLAPAGNCGDVVGHIPAGLTVIPMATLDDAVDAMRALASGSVLASCPGT